MIRIPFKVAAPAPVPTVHQTLSCLLVLADNLVWMRNQPENSFDSCVVDGPYGLAFMGQEWDSFVEPDRKSAGGFGKDSKTNENAFAAAQVRYGKLGKQWTERPAKDALKAEGRNRATDKALPLYDSGGMLYQEFTKTWAAEVFRILKPGGYLLSFSGTRTYHRMACGIENAGFEIRDQIDWIYGSGFPKSKNFAADIDSEEWEGWGTALKPSHEPICLARKPLSEKTVAKNVLKWGTAGLNIRGCEIRRAADDVPGWHKSGADGSGGYQGTSTFRQDAMSPEEIQARRGEAGRWPANTLFTETREDDCPIIELEQQEKGKSRFFYVSKPSKRERDEGLGSFPEKAWVQWQTANGTSGKASSMSEGRDTRRRNDHPTVKPVGLMRYLVRLVTPPGGRVLDCFMGSGTTGVACIMEGFKFVGVEQHIPYFPIAAARIDHAEWLADLQRITHENVVKEQAKLASTDQKGTGIRIPLRKPDGLRIPTRSKGPSELRGSGVPTLPRKVMG